MITRTWIAEGGPTRTAATGSRTASKTASGFADLVRRSAAEQGNNARAKGQTGAKVASQPQAPAVTAAPSASASAALAAAESRAAAAGLPYAFTPQAIEDHLNQWLMGVQRRQNEVKMQLYNQAVEGWQNQNARNRELGLPEVPPPPAPELAEVAPMPPGWWFEIHS